MTEAESGAMTGEGRDQAPDTAVFDVDGTLVDSNYQHAIAWYRAFRRFGMTLPIWRIHRHVGMGGDKIVAALTDDEVESAHGDDLRTAHDEELEPLLEEIAPLDGAHDLLAAMRERGLRVVLATSGKPHLVEHFVDLLGARSIAEAWTSSGEVEETKPAPDLLERALAKVDGRHALLVGDSTWDAIAAGRAGLPCIAVHSGGFAVDELREAGAVAVFDSPRDLLDRLDETPFGRA